MNNDAATSVRHVTLDNLPLKVAHGDVKRQLILPDMSFFTQLTSLTFRCNSGILFRILMVLRERNVSAIIMTFIIIII
jgi:hypothetical protein